MNWRIVTGYYITALGQESERYYFKTTNETIKVICFKIETYYK